MASLPPLPGNTHRRLFDFQVNGFAGVDFQRDGLTRDDWHRALTALHRHGVAHILVAQITDSLDALCRRFEAMERMRDRLTAMAETVIGYHLEGPWLSAEPGYRGAHPPEWMRPPTVADFERLQAAAGGRIRLVTVAPELPGCPGFIQALRAAGVQVSLGHTNASEKQIDLAIQAGARFCTHLGNATPSVLPRHDNVIQRLLARDELTACLVPDGLHLPSFVLRNLCRAKPAGRVLFTTDAMAGAAAPAGRYTLGGLDVEVQDNGIARHPDGGFAGSTLTPDEGVRRTAYYLGFTLAEAETLWSEAPLRAFGPFPAS